MVPSHRRMKVAGETIREKSVAQRNLRMLCDGPWLGGGTSQKHLASSTALPAYSAGAEGWSPVRLRLPLQLPHKHTVC